MVDDREPQASELRTSGPHLRWRLEVYARSPRAVNRLDDLAEAAARTFPGLLRFAPSTAIIGTASYMAREQASGKSKSAGPAADIYALGAILDELVTGRPPFQAATPVETVLLVRDAEPVAPRDLVPGLPRDVAPSDRQSLSVPMGSASRPGARSSGGESLRCHLAGRAELSFGRDGRFLLLGRSGQGAEFWDTTNGREALCLWSGSRVSV